MSKIILKKNSTDYPLLTMPNHYPADRVYLDGDTTKTVQDKCARKADLTNLDLTGTTNTTGSTISSGTYFYLNGVLVRAKTAIASGATFTLNTNYEVVTVGGLNAVMEDATIKHIDSSTQTGAYVDYVHQNKVCTVNVHIVKPAVSWGIVAGLPQQYGATLIKVMDLTSDRALLLATENNKTTIQIRSGSFADSYDVSFSYLTT